MLLVVVYFVDFGVKIVGKTISNAANSHWRSHVKLVNLVVPFSQIVANHVVDFEYNLPIVVSLLPLLSVVVGRGEPEYIF